MTKPRELSKILTSNTNITTDEELISTVNSASAYALSEANDYTDSELSSIDLTSTINTASAAAFASASAYTDSAIASFEALPSQSGNGGKYLSTDGSTTSWAALDLNAAINTASVAAFNSASANTQSQINALTTTDIEEGSNLYFTNQRAINSGSATYLTITSASNTYLPKTNGTAENLTVSGLFTVAGSATYINSTNLNVTDSLINLSVEQQQADAVDQGFTASYGQPGDTEQTHKHRGFVYDVSDGKWKLFSNVAASAISTTVNFTSANSDTLVVGTLEGNVTGNLTGISSSANYVPHTGVVGLDTTYLTQASASTTYLTQSSASSTYYTKAEAQQSLTRWSKVYSGSATTISGLDDYSNSLSYTPSYINLYINGILQDPSNYTASSGSTIVLDRAISNSDVVEIQSFKTFNIANTYTQTESDNKYLNLVAASSTYLTQTSASSTYLTQSSASSLYLTQSSASNNYLTQSSASTNYLTQSSASNTYALKTNGTLTSPTITDGSLKDTVVKGLEEDISIVASAATGTINLDIDTASILYYTSNASANHTLNIRYNSSTSLNSKLPINDTVTVVWMNTNGSTAYRPTTIQIDGSPVTPLWLGGVAPTSGNASSIDVYTFTIIKTNSATYTVLGSQSQYKA